MKSMKDFYKVVDLGDVDGDPAYFLHAFQYGGLIFTFEESNGWPDLYRIAELDGTLLVDDAALEDLSEAESVDHLGECFLRAKYGDDLYDKAQRNPGAIVLELSDPESSVLAEIWRAANAAIDAWRKSPERVAYLKAEQEQADRESAMMQDTDM